MKKFRTRNTGVNFNQIYFLHKSKELLHWQFLVKRMIIFTETSVISERILASIRHDVFFKVRKFV